MPVRRKAAEEGPAECGIVSGSDTTIVVTLDKGTMPYVPAYFNQNFMTELEINERVNGRGTWYGVIDGVHSLEAILFLRAANPKIWGHLMWFVKVALYGKPIDRYRQLAQRQNEHHYFNYFIETNL